MPADFLLLIALFILGFGFVLWFINKRLNDIAEKRPSEDIVDWLKNTNHRLEEQNRNFNQRLDAAAQTIIGVQRSVGEMSEIGRSMQELQEFLKSPKLRGNMGEHILNELLAQILPKQSFHLQYVFKSGDKVDAAIITAAGIICIDSKFPLENFRKMHSGEDKKEAEKLFIRDVKGHIETIAKKYILTDEGTIDYALMYIPSESVYYEIVNNPDVFEYAASKNVLPVSPTTFYAYLRAILMSFEGQKIEAQAKEILRAIKAVERDYAKVGEGLSLMGRHMTNAYNSLNNVNSSFAQLGQKIASTGEIKHIAEEIGAGEIKQLKI